MIGSAFDSEDSVPQKRPSSWPSMRTVTFNSIRRLPSTMVDGAVTGK